MLGLSAAKEQSLFPESTSKKQPVTPSVTVTPTSAPVSSSHTPTQKPFTITVTSVPSPAPATSKSSVLPSVVPPLSSSIAKDSFTSFLAQAEQQNLLLKKQQQQQQRKSYEAMIADINKVADFSSKVNSYSHEAKVNKWLAEQQNSVVPEQPLSADYLTAAAASRRRRPRVDPSLLDWKKLTGEEHVPVMNRLTGKKLTGTKAPQLKRLGQWLIENPLFDVDPKWAELVKERGNLTHDLQKRLPMVGGSGGNSKKGPGRPPLLASPTGTNNTPPVSSAAAAAANLAAATSSMASTLPFPSLATSGLGGLNSSLLSSLSLGQFDPKTNPLLLPFGGMSNMNALNSMGGLGSLGNMNLFANLAGLGIPGLTGMDAAGLAAAAAASVTDTGQVSSSAGAVASSSGSGKSKSRKPSSDSHGGGGNGGSSSKPPSSSSASSSGSGANTLPTTSPFPFFFPNPSLLYTPLGLGGLNPFTLQPGMSSAYDSLAQQCGLLNGTLGAAAAAAAAAASSASPNSSSRGKSGSGNSSRGGSCTATSATGTLTTTSIGGSSKHHRGSSSRDAVAAAAAAAAAAPLQQLLLPHDAHLLESISRVAGSLDVSKRKDDKKDEKRKNLESLSRAGLLPDFPSSDKLKVSKRDFLGANPAELSKFMELPGSSKRSREQEMKEALEQLSKTPAEFITRTLVSEEQRSSNKRPRELKDTPESLTKDDIEQPLPPTKKMKESSLSLENILVPATSSASGTSVPNIETGGVDIEALLTPSTVVKGPASVDTEDKPASQSTENITTCEEIADEPKTCPLSGASPGAASKDQDGSESGESGTAGKGKNAGVAGRRTRGKRKSGEMDHEAPIIERKNLRSSAGRAAAAAAARVAAEQAAAKQQEAAAAAVASASDSGPEAGGGSSQEECPSGDA